MREAITANRVANRIRLLRSQKPYLSDQDLLRQIEAIRDETHDKWLVCCGHDLICLLSVGLHKAIGSWNRKEIEPEIIERSLRLAYESVWFRDTRLYASIRKWEELNTPFRVFPHAPENVLV